MKQNETVHLPPVIKSVEVSCSPDRAFDLFTAEIAGWWPLDSHSLAGADHHHCEIEPRVGGRVFERGRSGREFDWGTVLAWSPPSLFRMTWRVGKAAESQQEVEVRFESTPSGGTRVTLIHSGWSLEEMRGSYDAGWSVVLGLYCARVSRA